MKNREIIQELFKVKNLLNRVGKKEIFFGSDLTVSNYELLKIIQGNLSFTISDIQQCLVESLASLTQKSQKLEKLDYLKKEKDKNDPRKNILKITDRGEKVIKTIEKKIEVASTLMFLKYSQKEKEKFLEILKHLERSLNKKVKEN